MCFELAARAAQSACTSAACVCSPMWLCNGACMNNRIFEFAARAAQCGSRGDKLTQSFTFSARMHAGAAEKMQREESWPSSSSLLLLICSAFIIVHLLHVCLITFLILLGSLYLFYALLLSFLPRHRPSSAGFVCVVVCLTLGRELGPILFGKTTGAGFADPRGVRPTDSQPELDRFVLRAILLFHSFMMFAFGHLIFMWVPRRGHTSVRLEACIGGSWVTGAGRPRASTTQPGR